MCVLLAQSYKSKLSHGHKFMVSLKDAIGIMSFKLTAILPLCAGKIWSGAHLSRTAKNDKRQPSYWILKSLLALSVVIFSI